MLRFTLAVSAALLSSSAIAQLPAASPAASAPTTALGAASDNILRTGTTIPMRTKEELTTKAKAVRIGQRVALEVAEDVRLHGQIVIPAGSPGMAEVVSVRNKGMWGKSGYINARVLYLRVGDRQLRLTGAFDDKGKTGTGGVVAAAALIPIAGFFTTGTSAMIPLGAPVTAFLDEDVPIAFAGLPAAPAPLKVAAPAPTLTVPSPKQ